jgi:hypothetical protein
MSRRVAAFGPDFGGSRRGLVLLLCGGAACPRDRDVAVPLPAIPGTRDRGPAPRTRCPCGARSAALSYATLIARFWRLRVVSFRVPAGRVSWSPLPLCSLGIAGWSHATGLIPTEAPAGPPSTPRFASSSCVSLETIHVGDTGASTANSPGSASECRPPASLASSANTDSALPHPRRACLARLRARPGRRHPCL